MPELPEVETVARDLRAGNLPDATITGVEVRWARTVATPSVERFRDELVSRRVLDVKRRGKYLVLPLDDGRTLLVHLRMTGRLTFASPDAPHHPHERLILELDHNRHLRFLDQRKFGRWYLLEDPNLILGTLGPEPFDPTLDAATFARRLRAHRRQIKPLLLDQRFLAGMGNIYADEALWEAGLHPQRRSHTLTDEEASRLLAAIRRVLKRGIENAGTTLGPGESNFYSVGGRRGRNQDALRVFRRTGQPCPRCGHPIQRLVVGQRGTHICPQCQPPE